ncbi:MAG: TVP38/TMEM64 family protein [Kofleriaceae bacterium]
MTTRTAVRLAAGVGVVTAIVVAILVLPVQAWTVSLARWIHAAGKSGVIVFVVAYVVAALLLIPGSALTMVAGFAFGPVWGTILVVPTSMLAAMLAFVAARRAGRERIAHKIDRHPRFAAIDRAMGGAGFKIVCLLRLSPVFPYSILNYALGVSAIRSRDYAAASFIGMLPGTVLYVYLGSAITSAAELAEKPVTGSLATWIYWVGLVCALVTVVVTTRVAQRALRNELDAPTEERS